MPDDEISAIVIICNKKDFYLTKILVASIRYYYPKKDIFLVKDYLNGNFSTTEMENHFSVKILETGMRRYGWTTAKIHLLVSAKFARKKYLMLDSDIVFAGRVMEVLEKEARGYDFVVSPEPTVDVNTQWFRSTYYNFFWAKEKFPELPYPGFTFNTGQMIVTGGLLEPGELKDFVKLDQFPYWSKEADIRLPCRDQSLLNIILPIKAVRGEIRLNSVVFMFWSERSAKKLALDDVIAGRLPYVIHWMGAVRSPCLKRMTRCDILFFFQREYYKRLPFGGVRRYFNNWSESLKEAVKRPLRIVSRRIVLQYLRLKRPRPQ